MSSWFQSDVTIHISPFSRRHGPVVRAIPLRLQWVYRQLTSRQSARGAKVRPNGMRWLFRALIVYGSVAAQPQRHSSRSLEQRILIVADDATLRATLARWLMAAGYTIELAESGKRAREVAATGDVALALVDPDGLDDDTADLIRDLAAEVGQMLRIAGSADETGSRNGGMANGVIAKPLREAEVLPGSRRRSTSHRRRHKPKPRPAPSPAVRGVHALCRAPLLPKCRRRGRAPDGGGVFHAACAGARGGPRALAR